MCVCALEKPPVFLPLEERQKRPQSAAAVAHEADLHGVAQPDAHRIEVDLHAACVPRPGQKLDVGKRGADHEQCVALFQGLLRRARPQKTDRAGRIRAVVGNRRLAEQGFDDGSPQAVGGLFHLVRGAESSLSGQDHDFLAGVEDLRRAAEILVRGEPGAVRVHEGFMVRDVARRALRRLFLLEVHRKRDVRDPSVGEGGAAGQVGHILHVCGAHHPHIVEGDVHEKLVHFDILLSEGADQVVKGHAGERQNRLTIHLGVIETVEQVDAPGA